MDFQTFFSLFERVNKERKSEKIFIFLKKHSIEEPIHNHSILSEES